MEYLNQETAVRIGIFAAVFAVMAIAETLAPRRKRSAPTTTRWASHLALVALNAILARLVLPMGAVGLALVCQRHGVGLLNQVTLPDWLVVLLSVIALDLAIYLQHVLFHAMPLLWRLHQVHHADLDFDVTTGLRFHTIEILLSLAIKLAVVALLGVPPLAVLIFEILLNATSMFNHANVRLPRWLDVALRLVVVTPDMHRVHHSIAAIETNSNFGFNLPWWDFLFGTYRDQPAAGHEGMTIGLAPFRAACASQLGWMLALPFLRAPADQRTRQGSEETPVNPAEHENQTAGVGGTESGRSGLFPDS